MNRETNPIRHSSSRECGQEVLADDSEGLDPDQIFEGLEKKCNNAAVFAALDAAKLPEEFMSKADRDCRPPEDRAAVDRLLEENSPEGQQQG